MSAWKASSNGQLGNGAGRFIEPLPLLVTGGYTFQQLSAGDYHTCAVTTSGHVYSWGNNAAGQLGDGTTKNRTSPVFVDLGTP